MDLCVCVCFWVIYLLNIFLYRKWDQVFGEENMFSMTVITRENKNYALYENEIFSIRLKLCDFFPLLIYLFSLFWFQFSFFVSIFRRILFCFLKGRPLNMSKITQKWYGTKIFLFFLSWTQINRHKLRFKSNLSSI